MADGRQESHFQAPRKRGSLLVRLNLKIKEPRSTSVVSPLPDQAAAPAAPTLANVQAHAEASARVLRQFRQVFNAVKTHFQQVEKVVGIGGAQVWALHVIRERPGLGVSELAQAMDVRQPTASNLVKSLTEQGLIEVRKNAPDRRAVQLHLLSAGARLLKRAPGPFSGVLPQALASLEPVALARLEQDLARLIEVLDADDVAALIPLGQL